MCTKVYKSAKEQVIDVTGVRACNYVKIETEWNFSPVLKIVTRTVHDQCSIFRKISP